MIKVTAVKVLNDYPLELSFNTGETRMFDVGPYLNKGIFTELRDPSYFRAVRQPSGASPGRTNRTLARNRFMSGRARWSEYDRHATHGGCLPLCRNRLDACGLR